MTRRLQVRTCEGILESKIIELRRFFDNNMLQTDGLLSIMKGGLRKFPDIESNRNYREKKTLSLT